jgi:hypothetical protein
MRKNVSVLTFFGSLCPAFIFLVLFSGCEKCEKDVPVTGTWEFTYALKGGSGEYGHQIASLVLAKDSTLTGNIKEETSEYKIIGGSKIFGDSVIIVFKTYGYNKTYKGIISPDYEQMSGRLYDSRDLGKWWANKRK